MKKLSNIMLFVIISITLCACTKAVESPKNSTTESSQGRVYPYELTDKEINLLQSVGLLHNYGLIAFHAPEGAKALRFNLYQLDENNSWESKQRGGALLETPTEESNKASEGTFSIIYQEDNTLAFYLHYFGIATFKAAPFDTAPTNMASFVNFISEEEEATLNQEIPVALIVYDSDTFSFDYTLADYFTPERFADKDIVLAVTLTFYDDESYS